MSHFRMDNAASPGAEPIHRMTSVGYLRLVSRCGMSCPLSDATLLSRDSKHGRVIEKRVEFVAI